MSLESLNKRILYAGGTQLSRINKQKLQSMLAALKNDYNSRMVKLSNGDIWAALINTSKLTADFDKKYISAEFKLGLQPGDTFEVLDDNTHWMSYLQCLTETAYYRSEIIRCKYTLTVNDKEYWVYFKGPNEQTVTWHKVSGVNFNDLGDTAEMFIKNDDNTKAYFTKGVVITIDGKNWKVASVDSISVSGILEIELNEDYTNTAENLPQVISEDEYEWEETVAVIIGKKEVQPKEIVGYQIAPDLQVLDGYWTIKGNDDVKILEVLNDTSICKLEIGVNATGSFTIWYNDEHYRTIIINRATSTIQGPAEVYPYDIVEYRFSGVAGHFGIDSTLAEIQEVRDRWCKVRVLSSKSGKFVVYYDTDETNERYELPVTILSL